MSYLTHSQRSGSIDNSGIRLCKLSPKYLESNAKSHSWVFSAIAELIDNAYDPDVHAKEIHVDLKEINGHECLEFIDDGNGLSEEKLYTMLSFGYSDKTDLYGYSPIGRYGNGFKSGSMRLGKDALVLTKHGDTMSVGFLSQTFHERTNADSIRIPIVTFDRNSLELVEPMDVNDANLQAILQYSIFTSKDDLIDQLTVVPDFDSGKNNGTKIIIWNLGGEAGQNLELQRHEKTKDIVCIDPAVFSDTPMDYRYSLRKYCSILFLLPRMKIYIMEEKVQARLIAQDLCKTAVDNYRMQGQPEMKITFGFNPVCRQRNASSADYGIMMYHKNRLIKAYEKVGCQKNQNGQGSGVIGVVEADYLTPTHNKQDFVADKKSQSVMNALSRKLNEYWDTKTAGNSTGAAGSKADYNPDCNWVQCDECLKWRRLPQGFVIEDASEWYCHMHPNGQIATQGCRAVEDRLYENEIDYSYTQSEYKREKQAAAATKKRKCSSVTGRLNSSKDQNMTMCLDSDSPSDQEEQERQHPKCRRVQNKSQPGGTRDFKAQLRRQGSILRAEPTVAAAEAEDDTDQEHDQDDDDEESRAILCVRCKKWKELPAGTRVASRATWICDLHPDENQRQCVPSSRSPSTRPSSNQTGTEFSRSSSVTDNGEVDAQAQPAEIALDEIIDGERSDDDINNQDTKESISVVVSQTVSAFKPKDVKREYSTASIQTDVGQCSTATAATQTDDGQYSTAAMDTDTQPIQSNVGQAVEEASSQVEEAATAAKQEPGECSHQPTVEQQLEDLRQEHRTMLDRTAQLLSYLFKKAVRPEDLHRVIPNTLATIPKMNNSASKEDKEPKK